MKARLKKAKGPNTHSTWWCYIVAVLLILIYLLPIYIMLNLSFRTIQDVGSKLSLPAMWNFQNYIDVFKSGDLWLGFKNSIVLVVETVVLEIVFSALAAYGLARSNGKIAESIRNVNMGIMMIPGVALLVGTYGLMVSVCLRVLHHAKRGCTVGRYLRFNGKISYDKYALRTGAAVCGRRNPRNDVHVRQLCRFDSGCTG